MSVDIWKNPFNSCFFYWKRNARRFSSVEIHDGEAFTDISNSEFFFTKKVGHLGSNQNELLFTMVFKILQSIDGAVGTTVESITGIGNIIGEHVRQREKSNAPFGHFSFCFWNNHKKWLCILFRLFSSSNAPWPLKEEFSFVRKYQYWPHTGLHWWCVWYFSTWQGAVIKIDINWTMV